MDNKFIDSGERLVLNETGDDNEYKDRQYNIAAKNYDKQDVRPRSKLLDYNPSRFEISGKGSKLNSRVEGGSRRSGRSFISGLNDAQ